MAADQLMMMRMEGSLGKEVDDDHDHDHDQDQDQSVSMETSSDSEAEQPSKSSNLLFKLKMPSSKAASSSSLKQCVSVNVKQHICSVCGKGFRSGKALGGHIRIHMDRYKNRKLSKLKLKAKKQRISNHNNNRRSRPKVAEEAEELEEEAEEDQYVSCCICNKNFRSMKSLFGHMRNHPERGWRGIRPPPLPSDHKNTNTNNSCCSGVSDEVVDQISGGGGGGGGSASGSGSDDLLKCLPKWTRRRTNPNPSSSSATATATAAAAGMWISNEWITEEIPEAAYSLMKLARGPPLRQETIKQAAAAAAAARPRPRTNNNIVKSKSHHSVPWKAYKPAKEQLKNKYNKMKKLINYGDGTSAGWLDQVDNNNFPVKVKQLPNPSTMGEEEEEEVGNINQNPTGFYPPDLNPSSGQVVFEEEEEEEEEAPFKPNEEGTVLFPQNTATQLLATDDHGKQVCSLRDFDLNEPYVSLDATDEAAAGLL